MNTDKLTAEEIIEAREFLIKRLHMTPMQATMLYSDYVNACIEFSNQKLEAYKNQSAVSDEEGSIAFAEFILNHKGVAVGAAWTKNSQSITGEKTVKQLYQIFIKETPQYL